MKIKFLSLLVILCVGLMFVSGCAQTMSEVNTEAAAPQGLAIQGTIYGTTINEDRGQPLANAFLTLSGSGATEDPSDTGTTMVVTSDANGEYKFENVDSSIGNAVVVAGYSIIASKEGYQRNIITDICFDKNPANPNPTRAPADNTVITQDIDLSGRPVILSITPSENATVETSASFEVVFNEPVDQSTVVPFIVTRGPRVSWVGGSQNCTTSWSSDGKTLTVIPSGLVENTLYRCYLSYSAGSPVIQDKDGFEIDFTAGGGGLQLNSDVQGRYFTFRTVVNGVPAAPTGLLLSISEFWGTNPTAEVNYSNVKCAPVSNWWDSPVAHLSWLAPASGNITGYRVWVSTSASGPWTDDNNLAALWDSSEVVTNTMDVPLMCLTGWYSVNRVLYGSEWSPTCLNSLAFVTDKVYFRVVAYNGDGEGTPATISLRDTIGASLEAAQRDASTLNPNLPDYGVTGEVGAANYNKGFYIVFDEPMDTSSVVDKTKWAVTTDGTTATAVQTAQVVSNDWVAAAVNQHYTVIKLMVADAITPGIATVTATISGGPKDLSGNEIRSASGAAGPCIIN